MKAGNLLPLLGVVAVGAVVACFVIIGETPDTDDPVAKIAAYYRDHDSDVTAGGVILMFAAAAFLAWAVQLRSLLFASEGGTATRATLGLVGSVFFGVGMTIFAGLNFALGDVPDKLDPSSLQLLHVMSEDLFPPMAVGVFLLLLGNGLAVVKTRALPAWLGWVAVIGALFALTPVWFVPFFVLAVFILVSSVLMATRSAGAVSGGP